jgi:hypothetical protein
MVKRKITEEKRIIEFLKLNGAVEVTEEDIKKDPHLQRIVEEDNKFFAKCRAMKKNPALNIPEFD